MSQEPEKRLNVRVDARLHKALRVKAAEDELTLQQLIERALRQLVGQDTPDEGSKGGACFA